MRRPLSSRYLRYAVLSVFSVWIIYVLACMHVLSKLNEISLITNYISLPYSSTSPVYPFPVAGWITDLHWNLFGHQRVLRANQNTNDYVKYLPERVALAEQISESLDLDRSQFLLTELVCAKRDNDHAMQEIKAFQKKWSSQPLGTAIQRCEQSRL